MRRTWTIHPSPLFELPKDGILPISAQTEASEQSVQVATHFLPLLHKIKTFWHPNKRVINHTSKKNKKTQRESSSVCSAGVWMIVNPTLTLRFPQKKKTTINTKPLLQSSHHHFCFSFPYKTLFQPASSATLHAVLMAVQPLPIAADPYPSLLTLPGLKLC